VFSFGLPTCAMEGLGTDASGPGEVSTYDIEALMETGSPTEPTFINSEPTRAGRKRKAKDMSGLSVCFCGEHAEPGNASSIQCRKAGCATLWVCYSAMFDKFFADTPNSITFNALGIRTWGQGIGCVSHACASKAQARRPGVASTSVRWY